MTEEKSETNLNRSSFRIIPSQIKLYWISGQIASWKVRLLLKEKQLEGYESKSILRADHMDPSDDFWKDNQYGTIPSLKIDNITLNGVLPIVLFLENWMPSSTSDSSLETRTIIFERAFESAHFQRACLENLVGRDEQMSVNDIEQRQENLSGELGLWNRYIEQSSMDGIVGSSFTLADILFFPELALAVRFGLSLDHWPCLKLYYDKLCQRPSIRLTWPYHWLHTTVQYDTLAKFDHLTHVSEAQTFVLCQQQQQEEEDTSPIDDSIDQIFGEDQSTDD